MAMVLLRAMSVAVENTHGFSVLRNNVENMQYVDLWLTLLGFVLNAIVLNLKLIFIWRK